MKTEICCTATCVRVHRSKCAYCIMYGFPPAPNGMEPDCSRCRAQATPDRARPDQTRPGRGDLLFWHLNLAPKPAFESRLCSCGLHFNCTSLCCDIDSCLILMTQSRQRVARTRQQQRHLRPHLCLQLHLRLWSDCVTCLCQMQIERRL